MRLLWKWCSNQRLRFCPERIQDDQIAQGHKCF